MSDERPDALLKSALEKIVYFEARAGSLNGDFAAAKSEVDRLKADLGSASQREIELRRELAEREVRLQRAHAENQELGRVNDALRKERATLIGQMLEASRIHDADRPVDDDSPFDLASFIAQLRNEVHSRGEQQLVTVATAQTRTSAPHSTSMQHAQRLHSEGRLSVTVAEVMELSGARSFEGRSEETLFGFSIRELSAPDPSARIRAAERLKALNHPASASPLAAALNAETEGPVQIALLAAFASVAKEEGAAIIQPLLSNPFAEVRVAALKALMTLVPQQSAPQLSAAMKDPDRAVRRRASLLALGLSGEPALSLGEEALRDTDADVRSVGALVLGASGGDRSRQLLVRALRDADTKVRKAAAQSLSRIVGEDVSAVVSLDDAQRRREIRRIASMPVRPVLASVEQPVEAKRNVAGPAPVASKQNAAAPAPVAPSTLHAGAPAVPGASIRGEVGTLRVDPAPSDAQLAGASSRGVDVTRSAPTTAQFVAPVIHTVAAVVAAPPPPPRISEALCAQMATDVRCAIRGRTAQELGRIASVDESVAIEACELLVARGSLIKRGMKYFAA